MYISILLEALDLWDMDVDDDVLLDHAKLCRAALPPHDLGSGTCSGVALAAEIAYDRALICLAAQRGIDVTPINFAHPKIERDRLEAELLRQGIDLEASAPPLGDADDIDDVDESTEASDVLDEVENGS